MLETGRVLTLENGKEYAIVSSTEYKNEAYIYIASLENENDTKVCIYKNNEIIEVNDENILQIVEPIFLDNLKQD